MIDAHVALLSPSSVRISRSVLVNYISLRMKFVLVLMAALAIAYADDAGNVMTMFDALD